MRQQPAALAAAFGLSAALLLTLPGVTPVPAAGASAPSIVLSPVTGPAGTAIKVTGDGFARNATGSLAWDRSTTGMPSFRASRNGSFVVKLVVPSSTPDGTHVVASVSAGSILASATFTVGSGASPSPSADASPSPSDSPAPPPAAGATQAPSPTASPTNYLFDDEFDGTSLAPVWGTSSHWTNLSEATADRSMLSVSDGVLQVRAERVNGKWRAGELDTFGRWQGTYGRYEARMKFTSGKGLWPAFWLAHDWTGDKSELDINETLANPYPGSCGDNSGAYYATVHLADGSTPEGSNRYCANADLAGGWHTYGMDWRPDRITFSVDGVDWYTYRGSVPTVPMPIILNLAVGGWAGASDATTPSPSTLSVDWVRVTP